jgi:ribosome-binding factor A
MSRRTQRLSEEIREEVARIIPTLKDPRVGFVTVTRTEMTPDLRTVRVHVGVLGDASQRTRTLQGLGQAAGFIRRELGRRLNIRHTPEVSFHYDEGLDATERVARLLDQVRSGERDGDNDSD